MKKLIPLMLLLVLLTSCNDNLLDNSTKDSAEGKTTFYTVSFDTNGGTEVSPQTVLEGMTAVEPKPPTKLGYVFLRWTLDNKTYDFSTPVTSDLELKAYYTSAQAVTLAKNDAKKIYTIADILVNKTSLSNSNLTLESSITSSVAADLVIYANNLDTGDSKLYIDEATNNTSINITNINKQIEYNASEYSTKIRQRSFDENSSEKTEDESTTTIKLENLSLKVTYTKETKTSSATSTTITYNDKNSVTESATFKNVNIVWSEKKINNIDCVECTVEMTIEDKDFKMSFTKMYGDLYSANYLGLDLTF